MQVRWRRVGAKRIDREVQIELLADVAGESRRERYVGGRDCLAERGGELVERPELVPQALRDRLRHGPDLLLEQSGHQPLGTRLPHLVEQRERYAPRAAVAR